MRNRVAGSLPHQPASRGSERLPPCRSWTKQPATAPGPEGTPGAVAVFGYVALVGFMFVGRLIGDRLVDRFGERGRAGGFIAAAGMGSRWRSRRPRDDRRVRGRGLGVATLIPAAMHAADQLPGMRPGTGLTV